MSGNVQGGILLILAAVALVELWRRGYLDGVIASARAAASGKPGPASLYSKPHRPFRVIGGTAAGDTSGAQVSA